MHDASRSHCPADYLRRQIPAPPCSTAKEALLAFTGRSHSNPDLFLILGHLSLCQREVFPFLPISSSLHPSFSMVTLTWALETQ